MLVLHALWNNSTIPGKLHLWAENSEAAHFRSSGGRATGRKTGGKPTPTRPHPFASAGVALLEAVTQVAGGRLAESGSFDALNLQLPSSPKGPLPSPQLIVADLVLGRPDGLTEWQVPTLTFAPAVALDVLLNLPDESPPSVVFGESLCYWLSVAEFSLELIARQNFVPTVYEVSAAPSAKSGKADSPARAIVPDARQYRAGWESYLEPADKERQIRLSRAMPPLSRAIVNEAGSFAHPLELVRSFVNETADGFVRQSLAATPLLPRRLRKTGLSLPEQWLHALSSPTDPTLTAGRAELETFVADVQHWLEQLTGPDSHAPFRTCFRLDPPYSDRFDEADAPPTDDDESDGPDTDWLDHNLSEPTEAEHWRLGFYLQATDDPTLLVEAAQVWQERSGTLKLLQRRFDNPQERLLGDLGRASRLYPALEGSLKTARPDGLELDTEGAYHFLRFVAPLLEQSGFGVLLPGWWSKPALRLGAKLKIKPQVTDKSKVTSGLLGLESLVQYDWQVALGDQTLSASEFEKLANLKVGLVRIRGKWVELKPEQLEAALAFFKKQHLKGTMTLGEALQAGLDGSDETVGAVGLPVTDIETEGWVKDLLDRLTHLEKLTPIEQPAALKGQLRPYQLQGVSWLAFLRRFGFGACLADDMGLGKSIQLIALLLHEREFTARALPPPTRGEVPVEVTTNPDPTLLVCPMSLVGNWQRELTRFAPSLSVMVHHGADRLTGDEFEAAARSHEVVLTTYALAQRDEEQLTRIEWHNMVLDEAQNIKNPTAKQTQAIRRIPAHSRIALTGTPVENRLSELWSIMQFLNPGYLGSAQQFRTRFATPIEKYHDPERATQLKKLTGPFVLRRLKTDKTIIADLPDKMEMKVFCNLTREQATLYEAVVKDMLKQIEEAESIQRRGLILSALMKLKQICNHPAQFAKDNSSLPSRSGKLARLEEMLEEVLAEGDRALIFSQFAEMGGMLRTYLQERLGREVLFLHGGTTKAQRDLMVERFGQTGRNVPPLFILSLKAGGVGLNLTAANHVFHFDRWWNPAVENQATDRAFRIGQQKNVQVHKFVCVGTLEERIDAMIEQKKELAESVVGSGESWLTELSTAQLRDLFALSRDAVGE